LIHNHQIQNILPKRILFVVIDALRYDYLKKMTFVEKSKEINGNKSFVLKCRVGNPTMTTQRIESLMTGSEFFSFKNILSTFLASKVNIDNIISQLNKKNKSAIIFGDDTWAKLFDFSASNVCENTYDVNDIHTCDQIIYNNLPKHLKNKTHDLIIAHFLAIDHVGHSTSSIKNDKMD